MICSTETTETEQKRIYRPLMPMTASFVIGIAVGAWLPGHFGWVLAAAMAIFLILLIHTFRRQWAVALPLAACLLGGYLSIQSWLDADLPDHHVFHFVDKGYWKIQGVVADSPKIQHGRWQFELATRQIANKRKTYDVCGKVKVTGRGDWPGGEIGDRVVFRGRLRSIRNFSNPGGFDYKRFMELKGIRARVYASAHSLKIVSKTRSGSVHHRILGMRNRLTSRMDAVLQAYSSDSLSVLKALTLGDRSGISSTLRTAFSRAGVGHVLAISGLHVGMVATVSFIAARWLLGWIPLFIKRGWVRRAAALVSLIPVSAYGLLSGLSPSTQRAMLMVAVFLLGFWVGRRHDWLNTLALAALIILVIYPPALLSISFQLSFSAVLAIIAGSTLWPGAGKNTESVLWKKLGHRLSAFLWVSAMAILGTLPLVLHYFNQISLIGLAVNLIVVPLAGVVVLPAGLLGAIGIIINFQPTEIFLHIAARGAQSMVWVVEHASSRPWAAVHCITPNGLEIMLYYLTGALMLFWKKCPHRALAAVVLFTFCVLDSGYWIYQRYGRNDLRVTALDVGQAGANLIELPKGYTILVDGGGFSDNAVFDAGAAIVAPLLWRKKIKTVDLVVLTHANSDHINGLLYILRYFNVGQVWSNQEPAETKVYGQWSRLLVDRQVRQVIFDQMPRCVIRNGVQLDILAPPADFIRRKEQEPWRDLNNNSLVLRVCYEDVSFLFTGDIMKHAEVDLLARIGSEGLRSTILMVPHHGSGSSNTMEFLNAVKPAEAVISAGWQNRFDFPHAAVLKRLQKQGSRIWCTADNGAVEIATDGKSYEITAYRPNAP